MKCHPTSDIFGAIRSDIRYRYGASMYACMDVYLYICIYVYIDVCTYACMYICGCSVAHLKIGMAVADINKWGID